MRKKRSGEFSQPNSHFSAPKKAIRCQESWVIDDSIEFVFIESSLPIGPSGEIWIMNHRCGQVIDRQNGASLVLPREG